jgi:hypothetical protein
MKSLKMALAAVLLALGLVLAAAPARADMVEQWADYVIGCSSHYPTNYQPEKALGPPNGTKWTPYNDDGTLEYLTLGYNTLVYASGATVVENQTYGFVYQVDVVDQGDALHTVWTGPLNPGFYWGGDQNTYASFSWTATDYLVKGLKIYVDTGDNQYPELIDAVKLVGAEPSPVPLPSSLLLLSSGAAGLLAWRRLRV